MSVAEHTDNNEVTNNLSSTLLPSQCNPSLNSDNSSIPNSLTAQTAVETATYNTAITSARLSDQRAAPVMSSELTTVLETIQQQLNSSGTHDNQNSVSDNLNDIAVEIGESEDESQTQQQRPQNEGGLASRLSLLIPYITSFGIFVLILLLKVMYFHRVGLLIVVIMFATWFYADSTLTQQISLKGHVRNRREFVGKLVWVMTFSSVNLYCIYNFFDDNGNLSRRLALAYGGDSQKYDLWLLLWVLLVNDFSVKYATIIIKCMISLFPSTVISFQRKGSIYCALERITGLYRALIPIIPWYCFLLNTNDGVWFSGLLFITYVVFKFLQLWKQIKPLVACLKRLLRNTAYGRTPTNSELKEAGESCAVCHDQYNNPTQLACKHIFCEECISDWFDREKTCPICRAQIITEDTTFRDGSSTMAVQFY